MDDDGRDEFRQWVVARSPALLRTAYLLTGSRPDGEDLLQTALAKTCLAWGRIREREARDGYVRRVMVNTDLDLHDALWTALAGLPKRQRAAVVLRYYEDLSEAETADVLGVSVGTVKSTASRALARLRSDAALRDDPRLTVGASG